MCPSPQKNEAGRSPLHLKGAWQAVCCPFSVDCGQSAHPDRALRNPALTTIFRSTSSSLLVCVASPLIIGLALVTHERMLLSTVPVHLREFGTKHQFGRRNLRSFPSFEMAAHNSGQHSLLWPESLQCVWYYCRMCTYEFGDRSFSVYSRLVETN